MAAPPTDESLMLAYCGGDLLAFHELYRRHRGGLYRYIAWRAPHKAWADEIAQDAWASLHAARARYQPQAAFRTFLFQIARNRLIDLLRRQREDEGGDLEAAAETGDPALLTEQSEQARLLHAAVRALPADQREALVLQQFSGLSLAEIAEITGVGAETVKSRLRYAMQKLRATLDGMQTRGERA